ncbi:MAG: SOS response-associated peptidase [Kiloniellales bacterium]|nr:SOS response-associated peptidase [Kiloniellales bacterium]
MCGRYTLTTPLEGLRDVFLFEESPNLAPRYNIAPTQEVPAVRLGPEDGRRHLVPLRWGLIPSWAKEVSIGSRMINARAESVAEKPAFRTAFRQRRCLIPADGFYEWQARPSGPKQPYYIAQAAGGPFAFAGLWERWTDGESGEALESFTIVTTAASRRLEALHHRMPVILAPADHAAWLDPASGADALQALLRPAPEAAFVAAPVSTRVNAVRNDDPSLIEPAAPLEDGAVDPEPAAQLRLL